MKARETVEQRDGSFVIGIVLIERRRKAPFQLAPTNENPLIPIISSSSRDICGDITRTQECLSLFDISSLQRRNFFLLCGKNHFFSERGNIPGEHETNKKERKNGFLLLFSVIIGSERHPRPQSSLLFHSTCGKRDQCEET